MAKSDYWQCNKRLAECLGYMFDTATCYDVTFLVGGDKEVTRAHKIILTSRSPVFYTMFEGSLPEKGDISVPDINRDIFELFLRYLYTDEIKLTCDNVVYLLYTAKKYCVDLLEQECREFLKMSLNPENACAFLEHGHLCGDDQIKSECRIFILEYPKPCLKSPGFKHLCHACVLDITQSDHLMTSEGEVYRAVLRWAETECKRQKLDVNGANQRKVLGDILYSVRFPCLGEDVFKRQVLYNGVLSDHEIVEIERMKNKQDYKSHLMFKSSPRRIPYKVFRTMRYRTVSARWPHYAGNCNAISFSLSKIALFHGIGIYGPSMGSGEHSIEMRLYDQDDKVLHHLIQKILTDQHADVFDIRLKRPIYLESSTVYTVAIETTGAISKYGQNGQTKVSVDGISVTFINSDRSTNGTGVSSGQIPCLLLSSF